MLKPNSILQNRYRLVRKLGQGGMGAVYEAIDQRVSCMVVLKETLVGTSEAMRQAFQREAALLANLRHASLPKVMDYFGEGDGEFLVMEYVAGHDLAELLELRGSPFPTDQVLDWADQLLKVLEYLHTREPPIIHRDIKPANLKTTENGEIFLLDFGLAKGAAGQMPTMQTNLSIPGFTLMYAPLEQILGSGTDPRSDLYSLAATLYDLLTGLHPISAIVRSEVVRDYQRDSLTPVSRLNPDVSPAVAAVIEHAMALDRADRPATAAEMRLALQQARQAPHVANTDGEQSLVTDNDVQFTVYSPRRVRPKTIYSLLAFAHLSKKRDDAPPDEPDPIEEMKDQASRILGKQQADYDDRREQSSQPVPREGELTFEPFIDGITFSPARRSFNWRKSVHREEFDFWASPGVDGRDLIGQMTVFLGNVVVAKVALTISVNGANPEERISDDAAHSARRVRQIYASYSHQDERVVAELAHVAPIFGSRFLMDRTHLEPGEDRHEGLRRLIRGADAFQLFWSTNSMRSDDTIDEIRYAASLGRPGFILPTYWEEPLPRDPARGLPPHEIDGLHFYRISPGAIALAALGSARSSEVPPLANDIVAGGALPQLASPQSDHVELQNRGRSPTIESALPVPAQSPDFREELLGAAPQLEAPRIHPQAQDGSLVGGLPTFAAAPQALITRSKKRIFMPILAGAAMVLFAITVVPVWIAIRTSEGLASKPSMVANRTATANDNSNASARENTDTSSSLTTFIDDFSDQNWSTGPSQYGKVWYDSEEYHMRATKGNYLIIYAPDKQDYYDENAIVHIVMRSVGGVPPPSGYGLVIHGEQKNGLFEDYGFLIYNGDGPKYRIVLHKGDRETRIVDWTASSKIRTGINSNQLEVRIRDAKMSFYINGQFVTSILDQANYKRGRVGLYTSDTGEVAFDDLKISR